MHYKKNGIFQQKTEVLKPFLCNSRNGQRSQALHYGLFYFLESGVFCV